MLSEKIRNTLEDLTEKAEEQEKLLREKIEIIQRIVSKCELALERRETLEIKIKEIVEEYKEAI